MSVSQSQTESGGSGGSGGASPPGGGVAAFRVVIYCTWALFGRCFFESILGFVRCKRWRARGVANFESQNATVQRFRPFAQTAHVHPAACSATLAACNPAACSPAACSATLAAFNPAACSPAACNPAALQPAALQPAPLQPADAEGVGGIGRRPLN